MRAPELHRRARHAQRTPDTGAALLLALTAVHSARVQLARIAHATDAPAWQVVDAADLLDAAQDRLAEAAKASP